MKTSMLFIVVIFSLCQGCLTCYTCDRDDKEAICVKPNDTIIITQDDAPEGVVHRYYTGGDSMFNAPTGGYQAFDADILTFTDSGYTCSTYFTGHHSHVKKCRQGGDDEQWVDPGAYEYVGYSCRDYKGH